MAKEDVADRLRQGDRAARAEEQGRQWHRDSYHRFFEGWTEFTEITPSGKTRIKRVYTAEYYSPKMSEGRWRMFKLLYFLALTASFTLFAVFAYKSLASNTAWYVVAPQALCVLAYVFAFWFLAGRLFAPIKMTIRQYRETATNLKTVALVLAILLAMTAIASLAHCLLLNGGLPEAAAALAFLAAGGLVYFICWNERSLEFMRLPNENRGTDGVSL